MATTLMARTPRLAKVDTKVYDRNYLALYHDGARHYVRRSR